MKYKDWTLYHGAWLPDAECMSNHSLDCIIDGSIWKHGGFMVRWSEGVDLPDETAWWNVIKDSPFDISALKAKRRWEIKKSEENFDVRVIDPCKYGKEMHDITVAAYASYPKRLRPKIGAYVPEKGEGQKDDPSRIVIGAFDRLSGRLCGYANLKRCAGKKIQYSSHKVYPASERQYINHAIVYGILKHFENELQNGAYIDDGARSIAHATHFQDYLQKYFAFRKSYSQLRIAYNPKIRWIVMLLYPLRNVFGAIPVKICHQIHAVLIMEQFSRECNSNKSK